MVFGGFLAPIVSHSSEFWYSKHVAFFMQQSTYRADALLLTTLIRVDKVCIFFLHTRKKRIFVNLALV
jgi:hypothetical protein